MPRRSLSVQNCLEATARRGRKRRLILRPVFCTSVVKVCLGSRAECPRTPPCMGQLGLRVFGGPHGEHQEPLEMMSVSYRAVQHGTMENKRCKDISTVTPSTRARHNTALCFHKDPGLAASLTSSKRT